MSQRLEQLSKLYQAEPTDPFLTYGIALEHAKAKDFKQAITWLDKTIELDQLYCYAYFQKARAYSQLGEEDQAIQTVDLGIEKAKQASDSHAVSELLELKQQIQEFA